MRILLINVVLACCLLALSGCFHEAVQPHRHVVFLIDESASIEPASEQEAFKAITNAMLRAHRGDAFSVIPITGDAEADVPGRILRLQCPFHREAYDQDLTRFRGQVRRSMQEFQAKALAHRGRRTDILGTIPVAAQEYDSDQPGTQQVLIIMSDFIQDDGVMDFAMSPALCNVVTANAFARRLAQGRHLPQPMHVFLGSLRSTDVKHLGQERRAPIVAFWKEYFAAIGGKTKFVVDGPSVTATYATAPAK